MNSNVNKRVLLIIEDWHLALDLQHLLSEKGNAVRWESDKTSAVKALREFQPDAMLTASACAMFISGQTSAEIVELPRPIDKMELLQILEARFSNDH